MWKVLSMKQASEKVSNPNGLLRSNSKRVIWDGLRLQSPESLLEDESKKWIKIQSTPERNFDERKLMISFEEHQQIVPECSTTLGDEDFTETSGKMLNVADDEIFSFIDLSASSKAASGLGRKSSPREERVPDITENRDYDEDVPHFSKPNTPSTYSTTSTGLHLSDAGILDDNSPLRSNSLRSHSDFGRDDSSLHNKSTAVEHHRRGKEEAQKVGTPSKKSRNHIDSPLCSLFESEKKTLSAAQADHISERGVSDDYLEQAPGWYFEEKVSLIPNGFGASSDIIGTIDFNQTGSFFATGGIARKVRIYSLESLLKSEDASPRFDSFGSGIETQPSNNSRKRARSRSLRTHSPKTIRGENPTTTELCAAAKLSSVKWVPGMPTRIACGDYDGVVSEWDIEKGLVVCERDEHSGQRVWSLDYSRTDPLSASSSDDGTVRLWSSQSEHSVGVIRAPSRRSICCAEFSPASKHLLAVACADSAVLLYDLRKASSPFASLHGHSRAASYVRFMGSSILASASIDNTIKLWDVSNTLNAFDSSSAGSYHGYVSSTGAHKASSCPNQSAMTRRDCGSNDWSTDAQCPTVTILRGHQNVRNFVGLSTQTDSMGNGLIATGSECNEVVVYQHSNRSKSFSTPVFRLSFSNSSFEARNGRSHEGNFVSAVCWRNVAHDCTLVSANSAGAIKIIRGEKCS